jgi:hypothetical protein
LNFDTTRLRLINSQAGDYLGTNVFYQQPVVTGGRIDFGMSKINGESGSYGDCNLYEFTFVLANKFDSSVTFNLPRPNYFTTSFTLSNISVYNATGSQPQSFAAISMMSKLLTCRYYIPVWPGDLNGDKKVTVGDLLPIGYFYNATGTVRPNASLQWIGQPAPLWGFDKTSRNSSAYKTFADGTADGIINLADQTSIGFNLSRLHTRQMANDVESVPIVNLATDVPFIHVNIPDTLVQQNALPVNEVVNISIGSQSLPLNNLYGIAFDLYFDPESHNWNFIF